MIVSHLDSNFLSILYKLAEEEKDEGISMKGNLGTSKYNLNGPEKEFKKTRKMFFHLYLAETRIPEYIIFRTCYLSSLRV